MQLLFHLVYYHSTCFGHCSCPSSGVIHKTVKAATSVCQCVWGEVVLYLVVLYVESGYNVVRVSMRIVLRIGPPSYTILVRSCVSLCCCCTVMGGLRSFTLVIYLYNIIRMHGTMNIKFSTRIVLS